MSTSTETIEELATKEYKYGFVTDIEADTLPPGLNEDVVRLDLGEEGRARVAARVAAQGVSRVAHDDGADVAERALSGPSTTRTSSTTRRRRRSRRSNSLDEVDPEIRKTYEKLGIPLDEQKLLAGVAVDAVFDSVSVATTFKEQAGGAGHHLLLVLARRCASIRSWCGSTSARSCRTPTTSSRRSTRRCSATVVRVHPEGRALPDGAVHVLPHQRARAPASSSGR